MLARFAPLLPGEAEEHVGPDEQHLEGQLQQRFAAWRVVKLGSGCFGLVLVFLVFKMRQVDLRQDDSFRA